MKVLSSDQHFLHYKSTGNSKVNSSIWPEIKLVPYFMPVLVTCKFDKDQIKIEGASMETLFCAKSSPLKGK